MNYLPVWQVGEDFPLALSTLYSGHSRQNYKWLTRVGPDGHRGRILWILIHEFNDWCLNRGLKYQLQTKTNKKDSQH
jgi:hypothetical protein